MEYSRHLLVKEHPAPTMLFALLGTLSVARLTFSLSRMVLQTFILPGQSVGFYIPGVLSFLWANEDAPFTTAEELRC